jgi:hypothetical protein
MDRNKKINLFFFLAVFSVLLLNSCFNEEFTDDPSVKLSFSTDTLRFDTVFTEQGSATRILKLYNEADKSIVISSIRLQSGDNGFFRLNIDGNSTNEATDVELFPNDSLHIFVEVTIDPDQPLTNSPFIIEDHVLFNTNGNDQLVLLEAWGQNANYIPNRFNKGNPFLVSCDMGDITWDDPKPYVIYGIMVLDSCNLIIPEGTQIYVHGGVVSNDLGVFNDGLILVFPNGKLTVNGTLEKPVTFQGDRLEPEFAGIPGQWSGIRIFNESRGNYLEHAIIKNSIVGIRADSMADVSLFSTQILNTSNVGLLGIHADIYAENCLIADNGSFSAALTFGGNYTFNYCTLASYGNRDEALRMDNFKCLDPLCLEPPLINTIQANFKNCIFTGNDTDEILISDATQGQLPETLNYTFSNCIVRVDELLDTENFPNFFEDCSNCLNINSNDTLFVNIDEMDYHLDTISVAELKAIPISGISMDLENFPRDPVTPDIGCYEYQY